MEGRIVPRSIVGVSTHRTGEARVEIVKCVGHNTAFSVTPAVQEDMVRFFVLRCLACWLCVTQCDNTVQRWIGGCRHGLGVWCFFRWGAGVWWLFRCV